MTSLLNCQETSSESDEEDRQDAAERFLSILCSKGATNGMFFKMMTSEAPPVTQAAAAESPSLPQIVENLLLSSSNESFNFRTSVLRDTKLVTTKIEATILDELKDFYCSQIKLSPEDRLRLCQLTLNQSSSKLWHQERKKRITASQAHKIVRAKSHRTVLKYFFEEPAFHKNLIYGRETEPKAKTKLSEILPAQIFDIGLVSKQGQPWLAASPDGLILFENGTQALLEVKCPSSCCNQEISVPYIENSTLKKNHPYYTQIQIQLYCCEMELAILFVYSNKDYKVLEVKKDTEFL